MAHINWTTDKICFGKGFNLPLKVMPKKCVIKTRKRWRSNLWVGEAVIVGVEEGLPRLFAGLQIILQFTNCTIELHEYLPPAPESQPHKRGGNSGLAQIYKRAGSRMCRKCGRAGEGKKQVKKSSKIWQWKHGMTNCHPKFVISILFHLSSKCIQLSKPLNARGVSSYQHMQQPCIGRCTLRDSWCGSHFGRRQTLSIPQKRRPRSCSPCCQCCNWPETFSDIWFPLRIKPNIKFSNFDIQMYTFM